MQLPSIDKNPRIPVKQSGSQVKKIKQTDEVHPRDYAYEMDKILDDDTGHKHPPTPEFGEDTYESTEQEETASEPSSAKHEDQPRNRTSNDDDSNIDISV